MPRCIRWALLPIGVLCWSWPASPSPSSSVLAANAGEGTCALEGSSPRGACLLTRGLRLTKAAGPLNVSGIVALEKPKIKYKVKRVAGALGKAMEGKRQWNSSNVTLSCYKSFFAPPEGSCPSNCSFSSPDPSTGCHWTCVTAQDCGRDNPEYDLVDRAAKTCAKCEVIGCRKCMSGTHMCKHCLVGYDLVDGKCLGSFRRWWSIFFTVIGLLIFVVILWYVRLVLMPVINEDVTQKAIRHRWKSSLRGRNWYPLFTNLGAVSNQDNLPAGPIGGPGLMLMFTFQYAIIAWVILAIAGWALLGAFEGPDIYVLGTYNVHSPKDLCSAIAWGRGVHDRLSKGKLVYTAALYVVSTLALIGFSVQQHRRYHDADSKTATMMDYAAVCTGFPRESGPAVEEEVESFLWSATGCRPVGVSVCWDFHEHQDVTDLCHNDVRMRQAQKERGVLRHNTTMGGTIQRRWTQPGLEAISARSSLCRRVCGCVPLLSFVDGVLEVAFPIGDLSVQQEDSAISDEQEDQELAMGLLAMIRSTGTVIAVFASERERDQAVKALHEPQTLHYKGLFPIQAQKEFYEPEALYWNNFGISPALIRRRMCHGVAITLLAIVIWGTVFYGPFAYYEAEMYATTGQPPGLLSELTFSMLVVVGNQIMYLLCAAITERVGFLTFDQAQEEYVRLYTGAVLVNMVFDIGIVCYTTYLSMVARGVRTVEGTLLRDLPDHAAIFNSYPMMKMFGRTLYEYNFPSCFLMPFICEAIFTILLPYHIGYRLVRSHHVSRQNAEACLAPIPMDLSRYGDLIVNAILAALCLFTASGWVLRTFVGLLVGCLFILAFDQYRVLRQVEKFYLASMRVDALAQKLLVLPCAVLAAAVIFQLHGVGLVTNLWCCMLLGFAAHIAIHCALMRLAVQWLGEVEHEDPEVPYSEAAKHYPGNWFTLNPVHCLRSKYLHAHSPPCIYYVKGKEEVLEANEAIGNYYTFPSKTKP